MGVKGMWKLALLMPFCFFAGLQLLAQDSIRVKVTGRLIDDRKEPAPFVNIIFREEKKADDVFVVSTMDGNFSVDLIANRKYRIYVEDPRYRNYTSRIFTFADNFEIYIPLLWRRNNMSAAYNAVDTIRNPAGIVIRNVIRKRNYHLNKIDKLKASVHLVSRMDVGRVRSGFPRWWVFSEVPDKSMTGINNLKEVRSVFYYQNRPRIIHEEVEALRTSGRELRMDYDAHSMLTMNFYENTVQPMYFSDMPFASPVGWGAHVFYKYELIETFYSQGELVYRISVAPRNKFSRTFHGEICISDKSHSIVSLDLTAPKSSGIYRVDSINIKMDYKRIRKDVWLPSAVSIVAWNRLYGTDMTYRTDVRISDYEFPDEFPAKFSPQQIVRAPAQALNYDGSYWKQGRQEFIGDAERRYFGNQDSVSRLRLMDKRCIDSLCRISREKFQWYYPLLGHTRVNSLRQESFYYDGLLNDKMEYNTVEGFTYKYTIYYRKMLHNGWMVDFEPTARFGFADLRPKGKIMLRFSSERHAQKYQLEGGSYYFQINQSEPINNIINSFYTLFLEQNFMKLYRKDYVKLIHERELINGLYFYGSMEFANRNSLENATDFTFVNWNNRSFTPNNPNAALDSNYRVIDNQAFKVKVGFTYKPKQKYMRFGKRKIILGSVFPAVSLFYTRGIPWVFSSDISYDLMEITLTDDIYFRVLGKSSYIVKGGLYFSRGRMTYFDYTHFLGEQTYFLGSAVNGTFMDQFRALNYYQYSTNRPFVEIHYQHDFKGFLLNQVPLVRNLKWNPIVGLNFLQIFDANRSNYLEVYVGIDNLLGALKFAEMFNVRVDVAMQLRDGAQVTPQFLVGIGTKFGERP